MLTVCPGDRGRGEWLTGVRVRSRSCVWSVAEGGWEAPAPLPGRLCHLADLRVHLKLDFLGRHTEAQEG